MKNLHTFEEFLNESILGTKGRLCIQLPKDVENEDDMIAFLKKNYPDHVYHPTIGGECIVGMLIKKGDPTLDRRNEPMCVYFNTNYNEMYLGAFPI